MLNVSRLHNGDFAVLFHDQALVIENAGLHSDLCALVELAETMAIDMNTLLHVDEEVLSLISLRGMFVHEVEVEEIYYH